MDGTLGFYLLMAFLGGVILNVMPCVLPVLTMKVFHLIEHAEADAALNRRHGIAYGSGVVATFVVLAGALLLLKSAGEMVGWGMQFSEPSFVAVMTCLVFVFGLNALSVFEFNGALSYGGGGDGLLSSFVNGVLFSV